MDIHSGPLSSQVRGDCQRVDCSVTGEAVIVEDPGDYYDDGEKCTSDYCGAQGPLNEALADGTPCPVVSSGVCHDGTCKDCWAVGWQEECGPVLACDGKYCVPGHCVNFIFNPGLGETALDCGGPCAPCPDSAACAISADCASGVCVMANCQTPTCSDGIHNDAETGVDCGAPSCPRCGPGQGCRTAADCASGVCWAGACEAPTCYDGVRNGNEADVDCGPSCDSSCP